MTKWQAEFTGREVGALGVLSRFVAVVEADTYDGAVLALYKTHEHISIHSLTTVEAPEIQATVKVYWSLVDGEWVEQTQLGCDVEYYTGDDVPVDPVDLGFPVHPDDDRATGGPGA